MRPANAQLSRQSGTDDRTGCSLVLLVAPTWLFV
jgi:hypothetical protein